MTTRDDTAAFAGLVERELARAWRKHPTPIHSLHEGYAVILEELDEFRAHVWRQECQRDPRAAIGELIQVAAMCQRVAEDCGLMVATNASGKGAEE